MVNLKNILALGLIAATASAATIGHEKRHVHHRRHEKKPCTTSVLAPFPIVGNSTQPAGTGVATSTSAAATTSRAVVTVSVVPVPVSPTTATDASPTTAPGAPPPPPPASPAEPSGPPAPPAPIEPGQPNAPGAPPSGSPPAPIEPGKPNAPGAPPSGPAPPPPGPNEPGKPPVCEVATSYVTIQQTVTVTAGQEVPTTAAAVVAPPAPSSTTETAPTNAPPPPPAAVSSPVPVEVAPEVPAPSPSPVEAPAAPSAPAAAPTTPVEAPSTPAPGTVYTGAKQGISWDPNQDWQFSSLDINTPPTWVYDWGQKANGVPSNLEYIPTLHREEKCAGFAKDLEGSGATWVKHFNEPDMYGNGGSGITPARAAELHNQYIAKLTGSYNIGLPAVTSHNVPGTSGTGWLKSFVDIVGCKQFKFADFHFYGGGEDAATQAKIFLDYVSNWQSTVDEICPGQNLPIWITEFAATPMGNPQLAADFMAIAGPQLDNNNRVARYAYFVQNNNLIKETLTKISVAVKAAT